MGLLYFERYGWREIKLYGRKFKNVVCYISLLHAKIQLKYSDNN